VPEGSATASARRRRWAERESALRARALEVATRAPGSHAGFAAVERDRRFGGGLLAGALAYRLFGALLPFALLVAVGLGYAATVDRSAPTDAADAVGIAPAILNSIAESSKLSTGTRWVVAVFAAFALLWAAMSAARAIRAAHCLAWEGGVRRLGRPLHAALLLVAAVIGFAAILAAAGAARSHLGLAGLLLTLATIVPLFFAWLGVSALMPHGSAPWTALIPGAVLVAVGAQALHLGASLFVAERLERASATYGSFGAAFTILVWLYLFSRLIVGSAMLNAALWERGGGSRG
jgi:membrane protein